MSAPTTLHELADVLAPDGWQERAKILGFWRPVMMAGEKRSQFIDSLGGGRVELWGGGIPWGTVMEIRDVPNYLKRMEAK